MFQEPEDAEGREEAGEDDEPHGHGVYAKVIADGGGGDPREINDELGRSLRGRGCVVARRGDGG